MVYYALNMVDQGEVKKNVAETQTSTESTRGDSGSEKKSPQSSEEQLKKRRTDIREKAQDRLDLLRERTGVSETSTRKIEQVKQEVNVVAQDPAKYHVDFVFERGKVPIDPDLLLIAQAIATDAQKNQNLAVNTDKLADYINLIDAALGDKPPDARNELLQWKERLARQLVSVTVETVQTEHPERAQGLTDESKQILREALTDGRIIPEEVPQMLDKVRSIGGGAGTWTLYDETRPEFDGLPEDVRLLIQNVNETSASSPRSLTASYLEGVVNKIDQLNGQVDRAIKRTLKHNIDEKLREETEARSVKMNKEQVEEHVARISNKEEYRRLGFGPDDVKFLESVLRNPEEVGKMVKEDGSGFEEFRKKLREVFDHLFDEAASNRLQEFEHSWSFYIQVPVRAQIFANLDILIDHFSKQERDGSSIKVSLVTKNDKTNKVAIEATKLSDALTTLRFRLSQEEELRRYNHNIHYVMRKRGTLEEIARYAQSLEANSVDVLFLEDDNVQTACHFYVQELKKTSADEFWIMGTTWLGDNPQGQVAVEQRVKEQLRDYATARKQNLSERDLNRLISLAAGTVFGITGEGFDILSQTKPPPLADTLAGDTGKSSAGGYFADNILYYWNLPHFFERWGNPGKVPELMYLKVTKGGGLPHIEIKKQEKFPFFKVEITGAWDHNTLEKVRKESLKELKTGLLWSLSGGPPLIEVMSKNFGIKGVLSRGSWRFLALTMHHLVGKKEDPNAPEDGSEKRLRVYSSPLDWKELEKKGGEEIPKMIADTMLWENVDWDKSFASLEKAGAGVMFSYWIDKRVDAEVKAGLGTKEQLDKKYYNEYLWKTRNRNPLIFLRYDLSQSYRTSLRYRTLGKLDEFKNKRENYDAIRNDVDVIERDLMIVTEEITRRHAWNDEGVDENGAKWSAWDMIPENRREGAKKYWKALQSEIWEEGVDAKGNPTKEPGKPAKEISDNFFKEKYFFFGSEDMDFREMAMREAGFDVMKRVFADIHGLSKGVEEFMKIPDKVIAAAQAHDYRELIGSIDMICHTVEAVHGIGDARRMGYYLTTMITRYFDKGWWAQLPFGVGTVLNWMVKSSLSEKVGGKRAWQWDEAMSATFINDVRLTGYLELDKTKDFNMNKLKAELGARRSQAIYDVLRSAIPLMILLMMWQATKEETKQ